jgi:tetratricopeptide (TPR) repeat protein
LGVRLALGCAVLLGAAAQGLWATPELHAQEPAPDPNKAKKLAKEGKEAYEKKDFARAAELFKQAHQNDPKPQLLFNIAQSLKEANNLVEAERYYNRYLREMPDPPNRAQVEETLFTIQQLLVEQMALVDITAPQEGLLIFVDDEQEPRCTTPCATPVLPGKHTISVEGDNFPRMTKEIELQPQKDTALDFTPTVAAPKKGKVLARSNAPAGSLFLNDLMTAKLPMTTPVEVAPGTYSGELRVDGEVRWRGEVVVKPGETARLDLPVELAPADEPDEGGGGVLRVTGYSLMGLGAGALLGGSFFGLSASSIEEDLSAQRSRNERPNAELIAQGEDQALYANLFYGVGAVALGTGVVLWFLDDGAVESPPPAEGAEARPTVAPLEGGAWVGFEGRF